MKTTARNRILLAVSFVVALSLALSIVISSFHSHGDGCGVHNDCAACLWLCEAAAVLALSLLFISRTLISTIRMLEHPVRSILVVYTKNGRAPPAHSA